MYSGHFHHKIKKNLVNAEDMFIAMGYKKTSNEVLVLDEPICADQVANVSRDCIIAYRECMIMKNMKSAMSDEKIPVSWLEILRAREISIGRSFNSNCLYLYCLFCFQVDSLFH